MGKISDQSAATPAADDYVLGLDVSDTTQSAQGSTRKFTVQDLRGAAARVSRSTDLTAQNYSSETAISWNVEDFDDAGFYDAGSPTRLTVPSGVTRVRVDAAGFLSDLTGGSSNLLVHVAIRLNGTRITSFIGLAGNAGAASATVTTGVIDVTPGDYFELHMRSPNDSSVTFVSAESWMSIEAR